MLALAKSQNNKLKLLCHFKDCIKQELLKGGCLAHLDLPLFPTGCCHSVYSPAAHFVQLFLF